jgi:hypothetical protein
VVKPKDILFICTEKVTSIYKERLSFSGRIVQGTKVNWEGNGKRSLNYDKVKVGTVLYTKKYFLKQQLLGLRKMNEHDFKGKAC